MITTLRTIHIAVMIIVPIIVTIILRAHVVGGFYIVHTTLIAMRNGVHGALDGNMMENIVTNNIF
jgi:hypothetical protein